MRRIGLCVSAVLMCVCLSAAADEVTDFLLGRWVLTPYIEYELDNGQVEMSESPYFDEPAIFDFVSVDQIVLTDSDGAEMPGDWEVIVPGDFGATITITITMGDEQEGLELLFIRMSDQTALFAMTDAEMEERESIASGLMEREGGQ
jgi:hypothetical protein